MLKKSTTYTDFSGKEVQEDLYFHLTKAELVELEMGHVGGLAAYLQRIVDAEDGNAIMTEFKKLLGMSYGKKSEDGSRFIKTPELRQEFESSEAYSEIFMELVTSPDKAAEFVNGIVPQNLEKDLAKLKGESVGGEPVAAAEENGDTKNVFEGQEGGQQRPPTDPVHQGPQLLTAAEVQEMDGDELKSGLATGRYKLQ